jgi:hypothetical protein
MIADFPPAITCVAPESVQSIDVVLSGKPEKLSEVLSEIRKREPELDLALSSVLDQPEQTAVIRLKATTPYRQIGGMIYMAQLKGVTWVAMAQRPPACSDLKK